MGFASSNSPDTLRVAEPRDRPTVEAMLRAMDLVRAYLAGLPPEQRAQSQAAAAGGQR